MRILVTGAKGFVGKNLCSQLRNIKDGKARWYDLPEEIKAKIASLEYIQNELNGIANLAK